MPRTTSIRAAPQAPRREGFPSHTHGNRPSPSRSIDARSVTRIQTIRVSPCRSCGTLRTCRATPAPVSASKGSCAGSAATTTSSPVAQDAQSRTVLGGRGTHRPPRTGRWGRTVRQSFPSGARLCRARGASRTAPMHIAQASRRDRRTTSGPEIFCACQIGCVSQGTYATPAFGSHTVATANVRPSHGFGFH